MDTNINNIEDIILVCEYTGHFKSAEEYCKSKGIECDWKEDIVELQDTQYHTNWNWIIPVIQKLLPELRDLYNYYSNICHKDEDIYYKSIQDIEQALLSLDISKVFLCTVSAIKLLNTIKDGQ